jgi:hypothetical protein
VCIFIHRWDEKHLDQWINKCRLVFCFVFFCCVLQWSHIVNRHRQHISLSYFSIENYNNNYNNNNSKRKKKKLKNKIEWRKSIWCIYPFIIPMPIKGKKKRKEFLFFLTCFWSLSKQMLPLFFLHANVFVSILEKNVWMFISKRKYEG